MYNNVWEVEGREGGEREREREYRETLVNITYNFLCIVITNVNTRHAADATLVRRLVSTSLGLVSTQPGSSLPPLWDSSFSSMDSVLLSTLWRKCNILMCV